MRLSEFWRLMDGEFGTAYARSLAARHVLHRLEDRTVDQCLQAGVPPRALWAAICDDMDVPPERRLGADDRRAGHR